MSVTGTYLDLVTFPLAQPSIIPSIIPLALGVTVMELYFGRYQDEALGWNSAVSNAVLLIATGLTLIMEHQLFAFSGPRATVAYGILLGGGIIFVLNFYHLWSARIAFNVSSAFTTYTVAYIAIAVAYQGIPVTLDTVVAGIGVFLTAAAALKYLKHVQRTRFPRKYDKTV